MTFEENKTIKALGIGYKKGRGNIEKIVNSVFLKRKECNIIAF